MSPGARDPGIFEGGGDKPAPMDGNDRALSPVVGTVLLVGVATVLATVLAAGVLGAGATGSLQGPPPSVVAEAGTVRAACVGCGPDDQVIRLRHRTGDGVIVAEMSVVVDLPARGVRARLTDLPLPTNCLGDGHVDGPDVFDGRCGRVGGALTAVGSDADGRWTAGESLRVRLRKRAVRLRAGEEVVVSVRHVPSGAVIARERLTVRGG